MLPVLQSVFVKLGKQIWSEYFFYPDVTKCVQMWSLFVWCAWGEWEHLSFRCLREYCIHCFSNLLSCQGLSSQDKDYMMCHFDPSKYNIQVGYGADSLKMFVPSFSRYVENEICWDFRGEQKAFTCEALDLVLNILLLESSLPKTVPVSEFLSVFKNSADVTNCCWQIQQRPGA